MGLVALLVESVSLWCEWDTAKVEVVSYASEGRAGRTGRGLPTPRPRVSIAPIAHLCLRAASRLWSWAWLRRSEVEEDWSEEDMAVAVVRVYVLLVLMTMAPVGEFGFGDLR